MNIAEMLIGIMDKEQLQEVARTQLAKIQELNGRIKQYEAVEAEWDPQAVARLLNIPLGFSIRAQIAPSVERLLKELDEAHESRLSRSS